MHQAKQDRASRLLRWCRLHLRRPELMVFVPAITLAAFWLGGEEILILTAIGLPLISALGGAFKQGDGPNVGAPDGFGSLSARPQIIGVMDRILRDAATTGRNTACLVLQFDDADVLLDRHGRAAQTEVVARSADRIGSVLRETDTVAQLEGGGFAVALGAARRLDLETVIQLAARVQTAIATPISVDATRIYVSCSVGFCLGARAPMANGKSLLDAAQLAADDASRHGPGAIRAFAPDMARKRSDRDAERDHLEAALDEGQIRPWFQPQLSTDTGAITGFEALARWHHPERGVLTPADFLPAIEETGLAERLGEAMLFGGLSALARWDKANLRVPTVGVNFSAIELRNPRLPEKLKWELDRFNLSPQRLSVEILETVVADMENDIILANIAALAAMGCGIDLDDFGTGHASITNIRRFSVRRIKIDRSFVMHIDEDREQQKMVSAILSLSERMGIETLAEGVETPGQHNMLAQLGCGHVQGYGIARPMPLDDTIDWMTRHRSQMAKAPRIGFRAG